MIFIFGFLVFFMLCYIFHTKITCTTCKLYHYVKNVARKSLASWTCSTVPSTVPKAKTRKTFFGLCTLRSPLWVGREGAQSVPQPPLTFIKHKLKLKTMVALNV